MRHITDDFIEDLLCGKLSVFLKAVTDNRDKLALEIRDGYISIYYKGGNLLKITHHRRKGYEFTFDPRYCLNKPDCSAYEKICALDACYYPLYSASPSMWFSTDFFFLKNENPITARAAMATVPVTPYSRMLELSPVFTFPFPVEFVAVVVPVFVVVVVLVLELELASSALKFSAIELSRF